MLDFNKINKIHFTGIKGVGMTNLALYLKDMGKSVSGSDVKELFVTDEILKENKIDWVVGFTKKNLKPKLDLLICTAAHGGLNNPEVLAAKKLHVPVLTYAEALALLAKEKILIATFGVGGKTTTSSIIAVMMTMAGLNPSYVIGVASINPIGEAGKYDSKGNYVVAEADDYAISPGVNNKPKFSLLNPYILVVHNVEFDHPDIYETYEDTKRVFKELFRKIKKNGIILASADSSNIKPLLRGVKAKVVTFGFSKKADYQIRNLSFKSEKTTFSIYGKKEKVLIVTLSIKLPGEYNVRNATASYLVGKHINLSYDKIKYGIESYMGCRRRFEKVGENKGVKIFDDYAHHPEELKSLLKAARDWFPENRIIVIFQPHTYSRTKTLFKEFSRSFTDADVVGFMDIYASARESEDKSVSSELLAKETKKHKKKTYYLGNFSSTLKWIKKNTKKGDILITAGAGDIFHLHKKLIGSN